MGGWRVQNDQGRWLAADLPAVNLAHGGQHLHEGNDMARLASRPHARGAQALAGTRLDILRFWPAYVLILPAVLWRATFTLVPLLQTFWYSLTDTSIVNAGTFVGLKNYLALASDSVLLESLQWTFVYTASATLLEVGLGLGCALLLNQRLKGEWLANIVLLLPWAVAPMLAGIIWKMIFIEDGGVLNTLIAAVIPAAGRIPWLSDPTVAKVSVVIITVWKNVSWVALIYLAALKALPQDVFEAAAVDGARPLQTFRLITLPMIRATTLLVVLLRAIGEMQTFEQIFGLTRGGPGTATQVIALYGYQRFFQEYRYGYGSAINMLLFALTALVGGFLAWRLYRANQ